MASPNHQTGRTASLKTRAAAAFFGTYGYELDLNLLSEEEQEDVRRYTAFMKEYRQLIQYGTFYRLRSPFEGNTAAWMVVGEDRRTALEGFYLTLAEVNAPFSRLKLAGLDSDLMYEVEGMGSFYGDELMRTGLVTTSLDTSTGGMCDLPKGDFIGDVLVVKAR